MSLSSLMSADPVMGTDAMIVVTVEYFKEGMVKVHANLKGKGTEEILLSVLQGAIEAVRNGNIGAQQ